MNWLKQTLANVAGTAEPEYGPSAIKSVAVQTADTPYTELKREDMKWKAMDSTCVETQCFYLTADDGTVGMVQIIYSNVGGIRTTTQFNSKIMDHDGIRKHQWCSDPLENYGFDENQTDFFADGVASSLSEDGTSYTIKSARNENCIVNLVFTQASPGFVVGKDGTTLFGEDLSNPWGSMFHKFWPRCTVTGTMQTPSKTYDMKGRGMFIMALQGMKPHHAAAKWNFIDFHTPTYSAVLMEFTTPPSYGKTSVVVGGIAKDGEIICAGSSHSITHLAVNQDNDTDWPEPKAVLVEWSGTNKEGQEVKAELMGDLGTRADRVDVLAHIPGFVKTIVGGVVGTKPYIYSYVSKDKLNLKVKVGENETNEPGSLFSEATFISSNPLEETDLHSRPPAAFTSPSMAPRDKSSYAGLGHGAAKRHRQKALKCDTIRGITKPDIRRLARRGGVKRIQITIYDAVREVLKKRLQERLVTLLQSTGNANKVRKTATTLDVCYTLKLMGTPLYGFDQVYSK